MAARTCSILKTITTDTTESHQYNLIKDSIVVYNTHTTEASTASS